MHQQHGSPPTRARTGSAAQAGLVYEEAVSLLDARQLATLAKLVLDAAEGGGDGATEGRAREGKS